MFPANLNCSMNNYFFLTFSGPEQIFLSYPCTIVFCVVEMNKELGWVMTAVPLKSFQWCVAQVDFSLVSSHYLHNSGACVPNKLDYYAATPSFLRNPDLFTADPTLSKILHFCLSFFEIILKIFNVISFLTVKEYFLYRVFQNNAI